MNEQTITPGTHVGFNFAPIQNEVTYNGKQYTEHKIGVFNGDTLIGDFHLRDDMSIETQVEWAVEKDINRNMSDGQFDNESLIGMYVAKFLWSDISCIGKIVGTYGKTGIVVEPWDGVEQTTKMERIPGGFAGHVTNNQSQEWVFEKIEGDNIKMRLGKGFAKDRNQISFAPQKHHDFNF